MLYLIYFYTPRLFSLKPLDKLRVIFHELYHIHPSFNGDIRRLGANKASHGHSKKKFNDLFEAELYSFYEHIKDSRHYAFLEMDMRTIHAQYRSVLCRRMKLPKPVRLNTDHCQKT
jgi:hypothetical protein